MQVETQKIKEIAEIKLGYSFRGKIEKEDDGNLFVIGAKEIKDNFIIADLNDFIKIKHPVYEDRLLNQSNVLLSNRGYFKASVFKGKEKTIAASSVYILKLKTEKVLAEYLAIWINSQKGQNEISKNTTGTMIKTILRADLENLKIDIPKLEEQKNIVELYKTKIELKQKLEKKEKIFENIFQGTLTKIINKK